MQSITQETIMKAASGDWRAFEEIYHQSSGFIYGMVLRMTLNPNDAKEITQDIFIKIYKHLKGFRCQSSFKTWAYRIAINTVINYQKKKRTPKEISLDDVGEFRSSVDFVNPFAKEENERAVEALLAILSPEQRMCIVLRNIQGLSYEEIAQTMSININTVRTRLRRARQKLLDLKKGGEFL